MRISDWSSDVCSSDLQYRWTRDPDHPEGRMRLMTEQERQELPEVVHPVVRTHPETGRKGIYVFPGISSGVKAIVGMDEAESDALLAELYAHCTQDRFQVRFKWRAGDLVLWDNRTTMHAATTDVLPPDRFRTLYRINTTGSLPI